MTLGPAYKAGLAGYLLVKPPRVGWLLTELNNSHTRVEKIVVMH